MKTKATILAVVVLLAVAQVSSATANTSAALGENYCAAAEVYSALDTIPDYLDTAPLPAAGTSAVWKYKAIHRFHDEQVGQWSDVVSVSVMG